MAQALPITPLKNIKPFKTNWKVQVKILHSWKQYSFNSGETLELVLSDQEGTKIHASVKKEHVAKYEKYLTKGDWKLIQNIMISHVIGQYRPTDHQYKIGFCKETWVSKSDNVSDDTYLSLADFKKISDGDQNQSVLCDILGQIVNVGEMNILEVANKSTKKIDFELRDSKDFRLNCTLWGTFAEKIFEVSQNAGSEKIICLVRFAKIREFRGVRSVSNAFNASTLEINPTYPFVQEFMTSLPDDGLALSLLENKPKFDIVPVSKDYWSECPITTVDDLLSSTEVGNAKIKCTIAEIDTDWGWYYFSCIKKNHKKVVKVIPGPNEIIDLEAKPKWWCDMCRSNVTEVIPKYKLHLKVKDQTNETKCMLFDSLANEIVKKSASELLNGSMDEIENPEDLPEPIMALVGRSYEFGLIIAKENLNRGHDTYKVSKVMTENWVIECESKEVSEQEPNLSELVSAEQVSTLMLTSSQETADSAKKEMVTPSSKRNVNVDDQTSVTKKPCLKPVKLEKDLC